MKKNILPIAIILAVSIALTAVNYFWIKNNLSNIPPPWDTAYYIYMGLNDYDSLVNSGVRPFIWTFLHQAPTLAPLFPATSVPFFMLFGPGIETAYFTNFLYVSILLIAAYFIAEPLGGKTAGWLSAFFVAAFPAVIAFSRDFLFEFPLAALTASSYLFFLKADAFRKRRASILFGVFAGLSVLTKTMGIVFFVLPFLYAVYFLIRPDGGKGVRTNVALASLSALVIAAVFYVPNFKAIFGYLFHYGVGEGASHYNLGLSDKLTVGYWTIYFRLIAERGISFGYAALFIVSCILFIFAKGKKLSKDYIFIWLWFAVGYFFLSIPENKGGERYALPILTPIGVLMAVHLARIPVKALKYAAIACAIVIGVTTYAYQTMSKNCEYDKYLFMKYRMLTPIHITCCMKDSLSLSYDQKWDLMPILAMMDKEGRDDQRPIRVLLGVDHHLLNGNSLKLYAKLGKFEGILQSDFDIYSLVGRQFRQANEIEQIVSESRFIITKNGFQGPQFTNNNNEALQRLLDERCKMQSYKMSDNSMIHLYKNS